MRTDNVLLQINDHNVNEHIKDTPMLIAVEDVEIVGLNVCVTKHENQQDDLYIQYYLFKQVSWHSSKKRLM